MMPSAELRPLPQIPEGLRDASLMKTLVPFVGAGASCLAGCPDWSELANCVLEQLRSMALLTPAQIDQIARQPPRTKLSIARNLAGGSLDFDKILHPGGWDKAVFPAQGRRIYGALSALAETFVTTNYDRWLDQRFPFTPTVSEQTIDLAPAHVATVEARTIFHQPDQFTEANLNTANCVFHLHGSVQFAESLVLTTADYLRRYHNGEREAESAVLTFLANLFRLKRVLFVGYSLGDLEILEYVVAKAKGPHDSSPGHFILQGYFSHEFDLMKLMSAYYADLGLELIPFCRDENDWSQLVNVLEHLARELPRPQSIEGAETLRNISEMGALLG